MAETKKEPTPAEAMLFYSIVKNTRNKADVDWDAVATEAGFKNAEVAKVRPSTLPSIPSSLPIHRTLTSFPGPLWPGQAQTWNRQRGRPNHTQEVPCRLQGHKAPFHRQRSCQPRQGQEGGQGGRKGRGRGPSSPERNPRRQEPQYQDGGGGGGSYSPVEGGDEHYLPLRGGHD